MKENSIRLRVVRSELARLLVGECIQETVCLGPTPEQSLRYELCAVAAQVQPVAVEFSCQDGPARISVTLSPDQLGAWAEESQTGISVSLPVGGEAELAVLIEKDFACLDRSDEDNADTFANPLAGSAC